jgi:membrane-bound lytic murein transglycosylase B
VFAGSLGAVAFAAALLAAAPAPNAPIPRDPGRLAGVLTSTTHDLGQAIDNWSTADRTTSRVPTDVVLNSLYAQRIELLLAQRPALARATLRRLGAALAANVATNLAAKRELWRLTPVSRRRTFKTGAALPPAELIGYYRAAERRFGVRWNVLAAVNFVETAFNKLRNESATGAQGPMQFMPATWRVYGLGGNVHDPHDAILGAANYLRASGGRTNIRRALHAYNPSSLYVDAVLRYARQIRSDSHVFYELYSWQVYVRTRSGSVRLTGPGIQSGQSPTR